MSITWKSLTALGIVGGLVPSVSALVILLAAISLHRIGFGLVLILSFSAGMALVLAGIGLLLVYAGKAVERFQGNRRHTRLFAQALPLVTAFIVLVSGVVVAARAAFEVGIL
jgi:ABC-type nickel/cobalt efflux system permease component RcnA